MRVRSTEVTCLVMFPAAFFYQKQGTVHWWVRCHQWLCLPPLLPPWPPESLGGLSVRSHGSAPAATHLLGFLIFATPTGKTGADSLVTMRMWGDFCNPVKCAETVQLALNIQCFYVILQSAFHNYVKSRKAERKLSRNTEIFLNKPFFFNTFKVMYVLSLAMLTY